MDYNDNKRSKKSNKLKKTKEIYDNYTHKGARIKQNSIESKNLIIFYK